MALSPSPMGADYCIILNDSDEGVMDTTIGFVPIVPPLQSLLRSALDPRGVSAFKAMRERG